jgi:hypothetical protein
MYPAELERLAKQVPLQEDELHLQWRMHRKPLLAGIARWAEPGVFVEQGEVFMVHPVVDGQGEAYPLHNLVCLEGAFQEKAQLPDVVRLAWQVSLLNTNLPRIAEQFPSLQRSMYVSRLAHLPVTLMAAEEMDLARCDRPTLELALGRWLVPPRAADMAETVWSWWEVYRDTRPPWPTALKALDRLV